VLAEVFPDATFVVTHRDPVAVTASMTTMVTYGARMSVAHPDPHAYGAYWADRLERMLTACVHDREALPAARSVDVQFGDFMADEDGTVARIYDLAGQPLTDDARAAMTRFLTAHPRGRHGAVAYDITQFGLEGRERRDALRFYTDRFGVSAEA
jgi:hypothetical protein